MALDKVTKQYERQRSKRSSKLPLSQKGGKDRLGHARRRRSFVKSHNARAKKLGLIDNELHPDGETPLKQNVRAKLKLQIDNVRREIKIHHYTRDIARREHFERQLAKIERQAVHQVEKKMRDVYALRADEKAFAEMAQQVQRYNDVRHEMYREHIDAFKDEVLKRVKQSQERSNRRIAPVLEQNLYKALSDAFDEQIQSRIKAVAFRNKIARILSQQLMFPKHSVVAMPMLKANMTQAKVVAWEKNEGDWVKAGDVLCYVRGSRGGLDPVEAQEDGWLAKKMVGQAAQTNSLDNNNNNNNNTATNTNAVTPTTTQPTPLPDQNTVLVGKPLVILVPKRQDVRKFQRLNFNQSKDAFVKQLTGPDHDNFNDLGVDLTMYNLGGMSSEHQTSDNTANEVKNNGTSTTRHKQQQQQQQQQPDQLLSSNTAHPFAPTAKPRSYMGLIRQLEESQHGFDPNRNSANHLVPAATTPPTTTPPTTDKMQHDPSLQLPRLQPLQPPSTQQFTTELARIKSEQAIRKQQSAQKSQPSTVIDAITQGLVSIRSTMTPLTTAVSQIATVPSPVLPSLRTSLNSDFNQSQLKFLQETSILPTKAPSFGVVFVPHNKTTTPTSTFNTANTSQDRVTYMRNYIQTRNRDRRRRADQERQDLQRHADELDDQRRQFDALDDSLIAQIDAHLSFILQQMRARGQDSIYPDPDELVMWESDVSTRDPTT